ncbi:MAG: hypothetical protein FJY85_19050 [Deltaproteobacteria bacterium]|nr:hypothetical protein [Deltaproteobacteria bacterium]
MARAPRTVLGVITAGLCSLWLFGCTLSLWGLKEKPGSAEATKPAGSQVKSESRKGAADGPSIRIPATDTSESSERGKQGSSQDRDEGKPSGQVTASADSSPAGNRKRSESAKEESEEADPPFKKHDHLKYVATVKNKAIDQLNKHGDAAYARLCRNVTTDQWSLVVYLLDNKKYSYISYMWDEIDQKWGESFASVKQSLGRWKEHLQDSSHGKECIVLKGGHLE